MREQEPNDKTSWSGEEVGKALIQSTLHDIKTQLQPDYKPLYTQKEFEKMEESIATDEDYYITYGTYKKLAAAILDAYNRGTALYQQFFNGFSGYYNIFTSCYKSSGALEEADKLPLIMTREQYERAKKAAQRAARSHREGFNGLLVYLLSYYLTQPKNAPEAVKRAINETKREAGQNEQMLAAYRKKYGCGYYTLPDGKRSDSLSFEQWSELTEPLPDEKAIRAFRLLYEGEEGFNRLFKEQTGTEPKEEDTPEETRLTEVIEEILGVQKIYKDSTEGYKKIYPLKALLVGLISGNITKWKHYTNNPTITKYELLCGCTELYTADGELKELIADYPGIYATLKNYIIETVPAFKEKELISWGELAELDIADFKRKTTLKPYDIAEHAQRAKKERAIKRAVAVVEEPEEWETDESGDYKETPSPLSWFNSLETVAASKGIKRDLVDYQESLIKPTLSYIYAYNELLDALGEVYNIPNMADAYLNPAKLEQKIDTLNTLLYLYYGQVYGASIEEVRKSRNYIKEAFKPLETETIKPAKKNKKAIISELRKLGYSQEAKRRLDNFDSFLSILRGKGA